VAPRGSGQRSRAPSQPSDLHPIPAQPESLHRPPGIGRAGLWCALRTAGPHRDGHAVRGGRGSERDRPRAHRRGHRPTGHRATGQNRRGGWGRHHSRGRDHRARTNFGRVPRDRRVRCRGRRRPGGQPHRGGRQLRKRRRLAPRARRAGCLDGGTPVESHHRRGLLPAEFRHLAGGGHDELDGQFNPCRLVCPAQCDQHLDDHFERWPILDGRTLQLRRDRQHGPRPRLRGFRRKRGTCLGCGFPQRHGRVALFHIFVIHRRAVALRGHNQRGADRQHVISDRLRRVRPHAGQ